MVSLGSFGTRREAVEPDTFDWFDAAIRTNPALSDLDLADFMEVAGSVDVDDPAQGVAAMGAIKGFLRAAIHPDDFQQFWRTGKENHQGLRDLLEVAMQIASAVVGRPTGRDSVSTDGPATTPESSRSDIARSAHPGRPDLQVAALRAVQPLGA